MRRDIFGLGVAQLAAHRGGDLRRSRLLTGLFDWRGALVAGLALAMSATSIALRILEERGQLQQAYGQRAFAILLFQDMAVVPLLALRAAARRPARRATQLEPGRDRRQRGADRAARIAALVLAGRYLLNPFFRLLAGPARAR